MRDASLGDGGGLQPSVPAPNPEGASTGLRAAETHDTRARRGWSTPIRSAGRGVGFVGGFVYRFVGAYGLLAVAPFVVVLAFAPRFFGSVVAYFFIGLFVAGWWVSDARSVSGPGRAGGDLRSDSDGSSDRDTDGSSIADPDGNSDRDTDRSSDGNSDAGSNDHGHGNGSGSVRVDSGGISRFAPDGLGVLRRRCVGGGFGAAGVVDRDARSWKLGTA